MKLQAPSSKALNLALQNASKCVASKTTLAILNHVLLSVHADGKFYFTSSTSDSQLTIPAPLNIVEGVFGAPVALPIGILTSLLATLPDCVVTFVFDESNRTVNLEYCTSKDDNVKAGKAQVSYYDGSEFPLMNGVSSESTHITIPKNVFDIATDQAAKFIHKDDLRPVIACLCIDIAEDCSDVTFVSTNGHMLAKTTLPNNVQQGGCDFYRGGKSRTMLVHMSYLRTLSVFDGSEHIDIEGDDQVVRFTAGDVEFLCKSVEGRFPNYNAVIPKGNPYFVTFDKKEMLIILKRVALFANESSKLIVVKKNGMFLDISTRDADFSTAADDQVMISDASCEEGFRIGFSSQVLATAIGAIPSDKVRMNLSDPARAAVFTADEPSPTVLTLCMPTLIES